MNSLTNLTPQQLRMAADIQERILALQEQLGQLLEVPDEPVPGAAPKKRAMSAAGRARIAAAAKARWAQYRAAKGLGKPGQKRTRKFSAAGKAKLAALARARWRKVKAEGKTRL